MLKQFITKLLQELELDESAFDGENPENFVLQLEEGLSIQINQQPNGFVIKSIVAPFPSSKQETFSTDMMLANLFGQGTSGSVLGLNPEGSSLVLTRYIDYPIEYKDFKVIIEDFINMTDFWREEAFEAVKK